MNKIFVNFIYYTEKITSILNPIEQFPALLIGIYFLVLGS